MKGRRMEFCQCFNQPSQDVSLHKSFFTGSRVRAFIPHDCTTLPRLPWYNKGPLIWPAKAGYVSITWLTFLTEVWREVRKKGTVMKATQLITAHMVTKIYWKIYRLLVQACMLVYNMSNFFLSCLSFYLTTWQTKITKTFWSDSLIQTSIFKN